MFETTLRVSKIRDGSVIDHITAGNALEVLKILGITDHVKSVVTVGMNVPSKTLGLKDMVKIEGRELKSEEVDKIEAKMKGLVICIVDVIQSLNKKVEKAVKETPRGEEFKLHLRLEHEAFSLSLIGITCEWLIDLLEEDKAKSIVIENIKKRLNLTGGD